MMNSMMIFCKATQWSVKWITEVSNYWVYIWNSFRDVMGLCETNLNNGFTEAQFSCKNFQCPQQDRTSDKGGFIKYKKFDIQCRYQDLESLVWKASPPYYVNMIAKEAVMNQRDKRAYVQLYKPPTETFSMLCGVIEILLGIGMSSANERRRYIVTSSLINWATTQNGPFVFLR